MAKILAEIFQICICRGIHFILSWVLLRDGLVHVKRRHIQSHSHHVPLKTDLEFYRIHSGQQKGSEFITSPSIN